jgi:hypothetical protein
MGMLFSWTQHLFWLNNLSSQLSVLAINQVRGNLRFKMSLLRKVIVINFQRERNKTTFFHHIFYLSPCRFTQISSVPTRWMQI